MISIYRFLSLYEPLIYIILAIGGMFSFRWLWNSWREWQTAIYSLEREFSARRLGQSAAISALLVIFFCAEFITASFVIPSLPAEFFIITPTLNLLVTPVGTLSADQMTQYAAALPPSNNPAGTGCVADHLFITSPEPGQEINGTVEIKGTVDIADFGFYKYEVASQGSDIWATISAGRDAIKNNTIGLWDTSALTPGDYQLRLVVTDNKGQPLPPCVIPVRITPK